ncbi:MAG: hypothetical protein Q7T91_06935 [Sulfuricurvum sp.]|nr:hypothetical protein [Sulfuricurvum sp.]
MKRVMACLFFIVPFLLTASPISVQTPPNLERFILENIGAENFFQGKNKAVKSIAVRKNKDSFYYPFDLYKSVGMATGVAFDSAHTTHYYHRDNQNYMLTLRLETAHNPTTQLRNSIVVLIFTAQ